MKFMKLGSKPDLFQRDGDDVRYVACDLATDIIVAVGSTKFYLHKFPLLSKSALLQKLVATAGEQNNFEVSIPDIPGGPSAFEMCAKFCYGMVVTLNCHNVMAARCAAEYLQMHETLEKGNLIYKIEVFLNYSIFCSWKDSIVVLQTSKSFLPWTDDLKVITRCVDSIASKACTDTSDVEWSYTYNRKKIPSENGVDSTFNGIKKHVVPEDWWVEDLCDLEIDYYKWVIMAIKSKGRMTPQIIGESLKAYTYRKIPGFVRGNLFRSCDVTGYCNLVETIILLLPSENGSVSCTFLLKLLKASTMYSCNEICKKELIKKIGRQLNQASVQDLLIPAPLEEATYDIDLVLDMVEEYVKTENSADPYISHVTNEGLDVRRQDFVSDTSNILVAKLIDAYLAEVAKDPNLSIPKFIDLAGMVPATARPLHDSLYRAIDMCLKEHPDLNKSEKKKLCAVLDCKKLSVEASMHAIQNERLPMRVIIQVLYFEQLRASEGAEGTADDPAVGHSLLPWENGNSRGSSMSAVTATTEDGSDGIPTADDLKSLAAMRLVGGSQRSSASSDVHKIDHEKAQGNKMKGILTPKRILSRLWSSKTYSRESSSSDASESPSSVNMEDSKSTTSRGSRYLVS